MGSWSSCTGSLPVPSAPPAPSTTHSSSRNSSPERTTTTPTSSETPTSATPSSSSSSPGGNVDSRLAVVETTRKTVLRITSKNRVVFYITVFLSMIISFLIIITQILSLIYPGMEIRTVEKSQFQKNGGCAGGGGYGKDFFYDEYNQLQPANVIDPTLLQSRTCSSNSMVLGFWMPILYIVLNTTWLCLLEDSKFITRLDYYVKHLPTIVLQIVLSIVATDIATQCSTFSSMELMIVLLHIFITLLFLQALFRYIVIIMTKKVIVRKTNSVRVITATSNNNNQQENIQEDRNDQRRTPEGPPKYNDLFP